MLIKNRTILEVELRGKECRLECAPECTWPEVRDFLSVLYSSVMEKINSLDSKSAEKTEEEKDIEIIEV